MCVIGLSPPPFLRLNWQTKKDRLKCLSLIPVMVRVTGVEPASLAALDPKSSASANSAIPAYIKMVDPIGLEPMTARL